MCVGFFMERRFVLPQQPEHHIYRHFSCFLPTYRELFKSPYIRLFIARLIRLQISAINHCLGSNSADYWDTVRWGTHLFGFNVYYDELGSLMLDIYPMLGEAIQADTPLASAIPLQITTSHVVAK